MKIKQFTFCVAENPALLSALVRHGEHLGYRLCFSPEKIAHQCRWIHFYGTSGGWDRDTNCRNHGDITIRDFFKLTPEDVIEKPEKFACRFNWEDEHTGNSYCQELTKNNVDKILEIMGENND